MIHNHIEMVWCTLAEKSIQYGTWQHGNKHYLV